MNLVIERWRDRLRKWCDTQDASEEPIIEMVCEILDEMDTQLAAGSLVSDPPAPSFDFRCRSCERIAAHRFVLVQPDRILVQCLACAETQCVFELASDQAPLQPEPLNEPEGTAITEQEPERD